MEQLCVELSDIEVSFLDEPILQIPKLTVYQFDRIGVVGKNGAGKSTLLKLMDGRMSPNKGNVNRLITFGYFDQLEEPAEADADYELLGRLSVPQTPAAHLSGGEETRLKLAQLLSTYYEGMLIDEPTTHLDAAGRDFLVEELRYYYGALVLVSHDRYVLDQLVTKIWEVDDGRVTEYSGNYSAYVEQKDMARIQQQREYEKYTKDKARLLEAAEEKMRKAAKITQANRHVSKRSAKAKTNRMFETKSKDTSQKSMQRAAKAIEQRVNQMGVVEAPGKETDIRFPQTPALQLHNKFPIMADDLTLKAGEKTLLREVRFQFPLGKVIAIAGGNGAGKTTLLRHIVDRGEAMTISPKVVFGVYEQMDYRFNQGETVLAHLKSRSDYREGKIRSVLHNMNFVGNDIKKDVRQLSGGEATRLVLCRLFLGRYNVLVLDEPTNFLDVDCIEALEQLVAGYEGTILLVSHDRVFVERVADHVYDIEDERLTLRY